MKINDAILGAVLIFLGFAVLLYARTLPDMPGQDIGPNVFPTVIAIGLIVFSIPLVVTGLRKWPTTGAVQFADWAQSGRGRLNVLITLALIVLYIVFGESVGFIPFGIVIVGALLLLQGVGPIPSVAVAVVVTLAVHYAFYSLLRVPLPWGLLMPIAW